MRIQLGVLLLVRIGMILGHSLRLLWLKRVPSHINKGQRAYLSVLVPKVKFNEEVGLVVDRQSGLLIICFLKVGTIEFDLIQEEH